MKLILLMAVTADGMIARNSTQVIDWTGKEDKKYFVHITRQSGVMIMGSKTFDMIGKALPGRTNIVMTRNQTRKSHDKDLIFTDQEPVMILKDLQSQGFESAVLIGGATVNSLFLNENLIDEIHVTIVPRLFGKGLALFDQSCDIELELINAGDLGNGHVLLKYQVKK